MRFEELLDIEGPVPIARFFASVITISDQREETYVAEPLYWHSWSAPSYTCIKDLCQGKNPATL